MELEYACLQCAWWSDQQPRERVFGVWVCNRCGGPCRTRAVLDPAERRDYEDNRDG